MKTHNRQFVRRGAILAVTLACLLVVGLLAGAILRQFVIQHRRAVDRQRQMQAFWLCESARSRAVVRAASADYRGETWELPADQFGSELPARAIIQVEVAPGNASGRHLSIETHYPRDGERRVVFRQEVEFTLPSTGESP